MPTSTATSPTLIPTARIPLVCPRCNATAATLFTGRRLSEAAPHSLSADTVWIPNPFPLDGAPLPPSDFPSGSHHEATAHFGACPVCHARLLTLSLSIASTATPLVHGQFVHDDIFLGITPRGASSRTLAELPTLFTVHNPSQDTTTAPQSWTMLRERYTPFPATSVAPSACHHTPHPSTTHPLTVDQHIFLPVAITDADLDALRGPGGLAIQHHSLPFWLPLLATLHATAPLVTSLAAADSAPLPDAATPTVAPLAA